MRISKTFRFEASHILPRHPGKCSRLHGHSYQVDVEVRGRVDINTGFVMDYAVLKTFVQPIIEQLDHRHLNEYMCYPSAENIAAYFAIRLQKDLEDYGNFSVTIHETADTTATWDSTVAYDQKQIAVGSNIDADEPRPGFLPPLVEVKR